MAHGGKEGAFSAGCCDCLGDLQFFLIDQSAQQNEAMPATAIVIACDPKRVKSGKSSVAYIFQRFAHYRMTPAERLCDYESIEQESYPATRAAVVFPIAPRSQIAPIAIAYGSFSDISGVCAIRQKVVRRRANSAARSDGSSSSLDGRRLARSFLSFDKGTQHGIYPRLIAAPALAKPFEDIFVDTNRNRLLSRRPDYPGVSPVCFGGHWSIRIARGSALDVFLRHRTDALPVG